MVYSMRSVYKEPKTYEIIFNSAPLPLSRKLPQPLLQLVNLLVPSSKLFPLSLVRMSGNYVFMKKNPFPFLFHSFLISIDRSFVLHTVVDRMRAERQECEWGPVSVLSAMSSPAPLLPYFPFHSLPFSGSRRGTAFMECIFFECVANFTYCLVFWNIFQLRCTKPIYSCFTNELNKFVLLP